MCCLFKNREGILHTKLYNEVKLISFKQGEVVLNTERIHDKSFNRSVAKLISTWTGRIWQVQSSSSNLGKSLYEEDILKAAKDASFQLYSDISGKDQEFRKLFTQWQDFRNEVYSWNKVNEYSFSKFSYNKKINT